MATSTFHSVLLLLVLSAVAAPSSVAWHGPTTPGHGGSGPPPPPRPSETSTAKNTADGGAGYAGRRDGRVSRDMEPRPATATASPPAGMINSTEAAPPAASVELLPSRPPAAAPPPRPAETSPPARQPQPTTGGLAEPPGVAHPPVGSVFMPPPPPAPRPASTSTANKTADGDAGRRDGRVSRDTEALPAPRLPRPPAARRLAEPPAGSVELLPSRRRAPPPPPLPPPRVSPLPPPPPPSRRRAPPPPLPLPPPGPTSPTGPPLPQNFFALPLSERFSTAAAFVCPAIVVMLVVGVAVHCWDRRVTRSAVTAAVQRAKQEAAEDLDHERSTVHLLRNQLLQKNKEVHDLSESSRRLDRRLLQSDFFYTGESSGGPDRDELANDLKRVQSEKDVVHGLLLNEIEKRMALETRVRELEAAARRN